ncbi:TPA: glycosyltransferase [Photobacterium damselae]
MKVVMVKSFFDTEANYQINEMVKAWPSGHELVIITSKHLEYVHKNYDDLQIKLDMKFSEKYGVKLIRLDTHFKIGMRVFFKGLKKIVDKEKPDILFMHGFGDFNDILYLYGKNKYLTFRDSHMSWVASKNKFAKLYYLFFRFLFAPFVNIFNKYQKVYALGVEEREYLLCLGINDKKIDLLPHGYNSLTYYISKDLRDKTRSDLKVDDDEILISYIGKFNNSKSPHVILDTFNRLQSEFIKDKKIKFLFLGGKDNKYMSDIFFPLLFNFEFKDRVTILNSVKADDLVCYYNATDICFWPRETTLSSIHAQVCGCKIIMENHTSNIERVVDKRFLFNVGDLDGAVDAVYKAVDSEDNLFEMSEISHREYIYQMKNLITSWESLLRK